MHEHRAREHEVELAELVRVEVVDRLERALHARAAQRLADDREAIEHHFAVDVLLLALRLRLELAAIARRPVVVAPARQLDADYFGRAAALELIGEEARARADVEDAHAVHALGEVVVLQVVRHPEVARRLDAVAKVDAVVPGADLRDLAADLVELLRRASHSAADDT